MKPEFRSKDFRRASVGGSKQREWRDVERKGGGAGSSSAVTCPQTQGRRLETNADERDEALTRRGKREQGESLPSALRNENSPQEQRGTETERTPLHPHLTDDEDGGRWCSSKHGLAERR